MVTWATFARAVKRLSTAGDSPRNRLHKLPRPGQLMYLGESFQIEYGGFGTEEAETSTEPDTMCLKTYFESKVAIMAPGESVTLTREALEWILREHGDCRCAPEESRNPGSEQVSAVGYRTTDLATYFGRAASTIRGWIAGGVFGDPESLKPNGRDYEIPASHVEEVTRKLQQGWRIVRNQLVPPESTDQGGEHDRTAVSAESTRSESRPAPEAPRPRHDPKRFRGRYGEWKQLVPAA